MPLLKLSDEERKAAVAAASADLKFHLAEKNVPADVQDAIFHKGFINLQLFAGLDETRAEVRKAVIAEVGLDPEDGAAARVAMASLLAAWESARLQASTEEKLKVESRLGQAQRVLQLSEMAAMRKAVEADLGPLRDSEVPAKSLVATKLEQLEQGALQAEDLREVLCLEDKDIDLFSSIVEHGTGHLKIRPGTARVALPNCGEELRQRHRLIAVAWLMCRTKHKNEPCLTTDLLEAFRRLSDFVLGKHVANLTLMMGGSARRPAWKLVLSFEQEIRKKAYQLVRVGEVSTVASAIEAACKSPELLNLHFVMPLTTSAEFFSSATSEAIAFPPVPPVPFQRPRKGSGKGEKGSNPRAVKKVALKTRSAAGRPICFRWNNMVNAMVIVVLKTCARFARALSMARSSVLKSRPKLALLEVLQGPRPRRGPACVLKSPWYQRSSLGCTRLRLGHGLRCKRL